MCGRFSLGLPADEIYELPGYPALHEQVGEWINQDQFVPRYNIAPNSQAPVLRRRTAAGPSDSDAAGAPATDDAKFVLHTMKWGLVPHWSKSETTNLSTMNARGENLVEGGGMWGSIKGKKRCVVLAQGYYEWLKKGKERLPHFTRHKDGRLMLLAGLYDIVTIEGRPDALWTFTIVTTAANKQFEWLHDRQPVILTSEADISTWLDTSSQTWSKDLNRLLDPYNDSTCPLECYPVPKEVGKVGTESPTYIQPVSQRKDRIEAMFSRQKQAPSPASPKLAAPSLSGKRKQEPSPSSSQQHDDKEDSDVEIVAHPPQSPQGVSTQETSSPSSSQTLQAKRPKAQPASPRKKPKKTGDDFSSKITSFFSKT